MSTRGNPPAYAVGMVREPLGEPESTCLMGPA
jgi:hypothetical protein